VKSITKKENKISVNDMAPTPTQDRKQRGRKKEKRKN
jgi:hypothetical protein